ncbi:unnamed protein product [Phaeothamnion confervicola]
MVPHHGGGSAMGGEPMSGAAGGMAPPYLPYLFPHAGYGGAPDMGRTGREPPRQQAHPAVQAPLQLQLPPRPQWSSHASGTDGGGASGGGSAEGLGDGGDVVRRVSPESRPGSHQDGGCGGVRAGKSPLAPSTASSPSLSRADYDDAAAAAGIPAARGAAQPPLRISGATASAPRPPQPNLRRACDECSRFKKACDGWAPCYRCVRRCIPCVYSLRKRTGPKSANGRKRKLVMEDDVVAVYPAGQQQQDGGGGSSHGGGRGTVPSAKDPAPVVSTVAAAGRMDPGAASTQAAPPPLSGARGLAGMAVAATAAAGTTASRPRAAVPLPPLGTSLEGAAESGSGGGGDGGTHVLAAANQDLPLQRCTGASPGRERGQRLWSNDPYSGAAGDHSDMLLRKGSSGDAFALVATATGGRRLDRAPGTSPVTVAAAAARAASPTIVVVQRESQPGGGCGGGSGGGGSSGGDEAATYDHAHAFDGNSAARSNGGDGSGGNDEDGGGGGGSSDGGRGDDGDGGDAASPGLSRSASNHCSKFSLDMLLN